MRKLASLVLTAIIAAGAIPLASLTSVAPAAPAAAVCPPTVGGGTSTCDDGDSGTGGGWHPVNSTGGGSGGPYCTSGLYPWKAPRNTGYPNTVKSTSSSIRDEFDEHFEEEWERIVAGYQAAINGGNQSSFYWKTSLFDLGAMFIMIDPKTRQLSVASTASGQQTLFNNTIQTKRTPTGSLGAQGWNAGTIIAKTVRYPHDPDPVTYLSVSPEGATAAYAAGSPSAPIDYSFKTVGGTLTSDKVIASINSRVGGNDFYYYMSMNGKDFKNALGYVQTALSDSWVTQNRSGWGGLVTAKWPVEIWAQKGGVGAYTKVTSANQFMPAGTNWYAIAIFPNRKPGFDSKDDLQAAYNSIINTEMTRKWTASGKKYYYYPVFMAPSSNTAPGVCGTNKVSIKVGGLTFNFPQQHGWTKGSWNHCRTNNLGTTKLYQSQIMSDPGACWLAWLKRPLDPPKLPGNAWNASLSQTVGPTLFTRPKDPATGKPDVRPVLVGTSVTLLGDRRAANNVTVSQTFGGFGTVTFRQSMVGFTAEIGHTVVAEVSAATYTAAGNLIKIPALNVTRTPLSRLQDADCQTAIKSSMTALARDCGIVYDAATKTWKYRIIVRTWWQGTWTLSGSYARDLYSSSDVNFSPACEAHSVWLIPQPACTYAGARDGGRIDNPPWPSSIKMGSSTLNMYDTSAAEITVPGKYWGGKSYTDITYIQSQSVGN